MQFDRGFLSPYFITDAEKMEAVLEDAFVLIVDRKIGVLKDLIPLLEQVAKSGRPLLVVAEDVEGEALATLIVNQIRGDAEELRRQGARLRRPPQGDAAGHRDTDRRAGDLRGARAEAGERGTRAARAGPSASSSTRTTRRSSAAAGDESRSMAGYEQIRREIEKTTSDYDREKLQERLAKLAGGVAVIRVGAPSEAEMKSKKEALDDAISATKAAVAEGIVPGGGLALLRCVEAVEEEEAKCEGDETDRRANPQASARGASPPDRGEFRRRRRRGRRAHAGGTGKFRLRCRSQGICRPGGGGHHRSDQGGAYRTGKCGLGRKRAAPDGGHDDRDSGGKKRRYVSVRDGNVSPPRFKLE